MKAYIRHIFILGLKEIKSVFNDPILLTLILYFFTLDVFTAAHGINLEVNNASVAVVNQDHSQLSRNLVNSLHLPYFKPARNITYPDIKPTLNKAKDTFVINIPPNFAADLLANKHPNLQLLVDATAITQAYLGSAYMAEIFNGAIERYLHGMHYSPPQIMDSRIRIQYNQSENGPWYLGTAELLLDVAILSLLLPGTALLREKEHGTIEHLLVMPLHPVEIMLSKLWSNMLIILLGFCFSFAFVVHFGLGVPLNGSFIWLFLGTLLFIFVATSMSMALATFANNIPQHAIISILVLFPMVLLSGAWTPAQSMNPLIKSLMVLSPLKYYFDYATALIFRGAGISMLWHQLLALLIMGGIFFSFAARRFRRCFGVG